MYADNKAGGKVFAMRALRDLMLIPKHYARRVLKASYPVGEWDGFGSGAADYSVGRSLCRKTCIPGHPTGGVDGWIHDIEDPTFGEVFLCTRGDLEIVS